MRYLFCNYLRKKQYKFQSIFFVGVRLYSFELKNNYIWLHEQYQGNLFRDYGWVNFKDNEAVVLVTVSSEGIVRLDLYKNRLTEQDLIEHVR
jgi:hypothetical protein